ncbi:MAG: YHS domain-containing protein [Proteobacteria bacterium]|nr:YHS domain-containing protein [Pseudomonadota bacterium]
MLSGKDPVCGMEITENEPTLNSEHLGQTVRFCSDRCKNLFDLNPEKYMSHSQGTHQHH